MSLGDRPTSTYPGVLGRLGILKGRFSGTVGVVGPFSGFNLALGSARGVGMFSRGGELGGSTKTLGVFVGLGLKGGALRMREERFEVVGAPFWDIVGCGLGMSRLSRGFGGAAIVFRLGLVFGIGGGCGEGVRLVVRGSGGAGEGADAGNDTGAGAVETGVAGVGVASWAFGFCMLSNRDLKLETDC